MEDTSKDPLVKDQLNDTPDFKKVISNGINGLCGPDGEHKMEITSNDGGNDENIDYDDIGDNDDDNSNENRMKTLDVTKNNLDGNKMVKEEEFEKEVKVKKNEAKVEGIRDVIGAPSDHGNYESEEINHQKEDKKQEELEKKEKQKPMDRGLNKNINAISEVTNEKQDKSDDQDEPALQVDTGEELMEVDENHDNTSDIECLDGYESSGSSNEIAVKISSEDNTENDETPTNNVNQSIKNVDTMSSLNTPDLKICDENGSTGSPDIEEITDNKSNGHKSDDNSPRELKQKKARKQIDLSNITPRRSSRNIKRTSYIEKEPEEVVEDSSDIEEIKPEDPLAVVDGKDKENSKLKSPLKSNKTTIVVNDTKRLVEIAAGSKVSKGGGKKEPTLVIIDTNSILSGRGGVPMSSNKSHHSIASSSSFSVMPVNLTGTTTMYSNMRTTITPVPMTSKTIHQMAPKLGSSITAVPMSQPSLPTSVPPPPAPQILPTLTDDMFVVEAPSFIVPYVYEKPPVIPLKEFVTKLDECIDEHERFDRAKKGDTKKTDEVCNKGENEKEVPICFDYSSELKKNDLEIEDDIDLSKKISEAHATEKSVEEKEKMDDKNKVPNYFDLPLGKFFMQIGVNLVQEFVQTDLLKTQKRKQSRSGGQASTETQIAINSLIKNLEFSKENNEPFHLAMKKCEFCNFKTESALVMQHHLETPHMKNYLYKCNFCPLEVRSPHDIRFHMEAEHNTRGRLEKGPAFHQCPNCQFEDNQKGKLTRHMLLCAKKFRPEKNLEPASDWEPPAKIPRLNRARNVGPLNTNALAIAMSAKGPQPLLPKLLPAPAAGRGRGRPPMQPRYADMKALRGSVPVRQDNSMPGMMYRPTSSGLLVPTSYQFGSNQIFPNTTVSSKSPTAKLLSQPSISITPLPRTTSQTSIIGSGSSSKPGGKNTFVICEICDGYIKDLEQLRNHMQWIHKVKIHPKMIYNRPPLNCQKCQFRFFTDQGLERHLLGSHGLVTSSMQEAANKGKDAGRCPACGKVYQWKLLNHVARDHLMTLKPAHLSYKCTVCTATFGMYKQFENHVYSAHSAASKQSKKNSPTSPLPRSSDSLLKPLKINDEITIIPQPAKPTTRSGNSQGRNK